MKVLCLVFCSLALVLYPSCQSSTESPPSHHLGRQFMKEEFGSPASNSAVGGQKEEGNVEIVRSDTRGDSMGSERENGEEGLIYNVDYHGVMTHPSPLPKHP